MREQDFFCAIVRILGLVFIIFGLLYSLGGIVLFLSGKDHYEGFGLFHYVGLTLLGLIPGLYFLRGASHLVEFAYSSQKDI